MLLFAGSWGSPSQLISIRRPQLEEGQLRAAAPFEDSLAPIHDAVRFQEPAGEPTAVADPLGRPPQPCGQVNAQDIG